MKKAVMAALVLVASGVMAQEAAKPISLKPVPVWTNKAPEVVRTTLTGIVKSDEATAIMLKLAETFDIGADEKAAADKTVSFVSYALQPNGTYRVIVVLTPNVAIKPVTPIDIKPK